MTGMDIFNVIVGVSTIVSLALSIFATTKVISIRNSLMVTNRETSNTTGNQTITGDANNQSGGSIVR